MRTIPKSFEVNECVICQKRFATKGGLTFHIRIKRHYDLGPGVVKCTKCVKFPGSPHICSGISVRNRQADMFTFLISQCAANGCVLAMSQNENLLLDWQRFISRILSNAKKQLSTTRIPNYSECSSFKYLCIFFVRHRVVYFT